VVCGGAAGDVAGNRNLNRVQTPSRKHLLSAQLCAYRSRDPFLWRNLAAFYATGEGTGRVDLVRARRWYSRAANAGDATATYELGLMYLQGEGGRKRPAQGRRLLVRAARQGEIAALQVLRYAYSKGAWGFPRSTERARAVSLALRRILRTARRVRESGSGAAS